MIYHEEPRVPPDWINDRLDVELRCLLDEGRANHCICVECDGKDSKRRYLHSELALLNYISVEDDEDIPGDYLVTPLEKGRTYYERLSRYNSDLACKKYKDELACEAREKEAEAQRKHEKDLKFIEVVPRTIVAALVPFATFAAVLAPVFYGSSWGDIGKAAAFLVVGVAIGLVVGRFVWRKKQ